MLRLCCSIMVHLGVVVLAPYFSHVAVCDAQVSMLPGVLHAARTDCAHCGNCTALGGMS